MTDFSHPRYAAETGHLITVQTPAQDAPRILDHIHRISPLTYGDYDMVSYVSGAGTQAFRSLGTGRNAATDGAVSVPCTEVRVFVADAAAEVVAAIYDAHPYEEPVIFVTPATRTLHRRGMDEDNPNRFWNRETADWVPEAHRP